MELESEQRTLMRSLCEFVDALRDIKSPEDADILTRDVLQAVRGLCASSETPTSVAWHEDVWRRGIVPTFQRLCLCMTRLDQMEMQKAKDKGQESLVQEDKPKAPLGLLSLRDYSVLQAAIEVLFCWAAYPRVAAGVLLPVEKRKHTRTLASEWGVLELGGTRSVIC